MPDVTSLSVVFLLLALCPLDVAGFPQDMKVMCLLENKNVISVMDLATQKMIHQINTTESVSAFDFEPVNKRLCWCSWEKHCYVQDYDGSNAHLLFSTDARVLVVEVNQTSSLYYLDENDRIWVIRNGERAKMERNETKALTRDDANGRVFVVDEGDSQVYSFPEERPLKINGDPAFIGHVSWNPSDSLLYFTTYFAEGTEIRRVDVETGVQKSIIKLNARVKQLSAYRDVIVFCIIGTEYKCKLNAVFTNGTNLTSLGETTYAYTRPVLFDEASIPDSAITKQFSMQGLQTVFAWTPKIGCLQTEGGTSIKVSLTPGLEDFTLLVMDPPDGCSRDLGQFRQDIIIPESCVVGQKVEVAVQLTEIKDILGGRFFRHFLFSCSDLKPDGKAVELTADTNPSETQATACNASYADGVFSLMVVTSDNLRSDAELTRATDVIWSQNGVFLVMRHRLATGRQHRTLIPAECTISSTSHPQKKTIWLAKPGMECKQEMGLIAAWTIQSKRTLEDDVTYTQLFPFDFQVGEKVTITCDARECPYVADAAELQGECLEAFEKYRECGGTFRRSSSRRRREVTSLSGNGSNPLDQAASRVMSASFTLV